MAVHPACYTWSHCQSSVYTRNVSHRSWILNKIGSSGGPGDPAPDDSCPIPPTGTELTFGKTITGLSGAKGALLQFYIDVPSGAADIRFRSWYGSGDVDLYIAKGREASPDDHDYAPFKDGNAECVRVKNPSGGRWYISLHGYAAFNNVKLRAVVTP